MRRTTRSSVVVPLLLLATAGCTFIRTEYGPPLDVADDRFHPGTTDVHEVLEELGPPAKVSALADGMAFLYEHQTFRERQFGINIPGLDFFKLSVGKAYGDIDTLLLQFDETGRLINHRFEARRLRLGTGTSIQFFFSVTPTVDTSAAEADHDINDWGAMLLRPLPEMINTDQSLETGEQGLQRRGTPLKAGQHTLEMR